MKSFRRPFTIIVAAAALAVTGFSTGAEADPTTKRVHGRSTFETTTVDCTSPVGLCHVGRARGFPSGPFEFVADRFAPSDTPTVLFFTGRIVQHTRDGEIYCTVAGTTDVVSPDGEFASMCTITGGTERWEGATGYVQLVGSLTGGSAEFQGKITTP